jgi:translation initiation factor eIF-2B subunit gamma
MVNIHLINTAEAFIKIVVAITVVTPPESEPALQSAFKTHPALTSLPSPRPDIIAPAELQQTSGTGQILRLPEIQKCITTDFVIVPCDLISELDGSRLIQQWITLNPLTSASGTAQRGGLGLFYPTQGLEGISHKKDETDFIATTPVPQAPVPPPQGSLRAEIERVVMTMPTDTLNDKLEEDKEVLKIRTQLLHKHGRVKLKTKYRDSHVYVFPRWVKDFAAQNARFESISEDILGWWAKASWQKGLAEKLGMQDVLVRKRSTITDMDGSMMDDDDAAEVEILSSTRALDKTQSSSAKFARRVGSTSDTTAPQIVVPPLLAYIQPPHTTGAATASNPLIRRVDTSAAILNISLYLAKQPTTHVLAHESKVHPTAQIGQQSRVATEDSLVAENVNIGTRVVIKESVIGANCEIGNNVRLTRCLLMDGVRVGDGVQLTGCIIGRRARIEGMKPVEPIPTSADGADAAIQGKKKKSNVDDDDERTKLTECEVAPNFVVEAGTEAKGEKLMPFDTDDLDDLEDDDAEDMNDGL